MRGDGVGSGVLSCAHTALCSCVMAMRSWHTWVCCYTSHLFNFKRYPGILRRHRG